jgi:hypothetical protein
VAALRRGPYILELTMPAIDGVRLKIGWQTYMESQSITPIFFFSELDLSFGSQQ